MQQASRFYLPFLGNFIPFADNEKEMFKKLTKEAIAKRLSTLGKVKTAFAWITLLFFVGYYLFKIIDSRGHIPFLIIYCVLLVLLIITTILGQRVAKTHGERRSKSTYRLAVNSFKHLAKVALIVVTSIDFAKYGYGFFDVALVVINSLMLLSSMFFELTYYVLYRQYLNVSERIKALRSAREMASETDVPQ